MGILSILRLPEAKVNEDIDSPETLALHRRIIQNKPFLRRLYIDFYREFLRYLPSQYEVRNVVEIGSGGGFIKEVMPSVITSDVRISEMVDIGFSAEKMPLKNRSIDAFLLLNVFHHFPRPLTCLREMSRCLRSEGRIIMIEPANTAWRRFLDRRCHSELFDIHAGWELAAGGPMSSANGALAWIIFCRDGKILEKKLPEIKIKKSQLHTPFRYILSGGLSYRQIVPSFLYDVVKCVEVCLTPFNPWCAYFQTFVLEKQ